MRRKNKSNTVIIGQGDVTLDQIIEVAQNRASVEVSDLPEFIARMEASRSVLTCAIKRGVSVYGVTTGYDAACGNRIGTDEIEALGNNLVAYHGCGVDKPLGIEETRAAMLCRLICLARGLSGVTVDLLRHLAQFLNAGITPLVPSLGSVGASGDLTPLSYIAACLSGKRDVLFGGEILPAAVALERIGMQPYRFAPKEPLGLMNGTSVMTGIAVIAVQRSKKLLNAAIAATALAVHALEGHVDHFHAVLVDAKPHFGQKRTGERLRAILAPAGIPQESIHHEHQQDPYSIRCAPQILGVVADALEWIEAWVMAEVNSTNDNPLFDARSGQVLMGGNFYGGHIAAMKSALAMIADMLDRQIALLVDTRFNRGLPANLVKVQGAGHVVHHGFKGVQITASALAAEAQKNTLPAASFSRSIEAHNQDKVSLGTISAREALQQCYLVAWVVAVHLMVAAQACEIRGGIELRPGVNKIVGSIRQRVGDTVEDRPMGKDIDTLAQALYEMVWDE